VTREPRDFKLGTLTYHSKSHPADEKYSLKGAWSGSREQFLHRGLRKLTNACGLIANDGHENDRPSKLHDMKLQDTKLQDSNLQDIKSQGMKEQDMKMPDMKLHDKRIHNAVFLVIF